MKKLKTFESFINEDYVIEAKEIPADGEYTGWCCSVNLHLNEINKDYKMEMGVRARFDGKISIRNKHVYLMEGTQHFGGKDFKAYIKDPSVGLHLGTFEKIDWDDI